MTYNYSKLRGKIVEVFGSARVFAKKIGWSERTMSLKLNNKRAWRQDDIRKAVDLLGIDQNDVGAYFFTIEV